MTIEEFNRTGWKMNMTAKYHGDGETYPVLAVDFGEQLAQIGYTTFLGNAMSYAIAEKPGPVGLKGVEDEICWARCEHVTLNAPNIVLSEPGSQNRHA